MLVVLRTELECAVKRRGTLVGEDIPTWQLLLRPEALEAVVEATKQLKPSRGKGRTGDSASIQAQRE